MQQSWVPARLSPEQREERRRAAAALFPRVHRGTLSQAAVARQLGVSREAVRKWYAAWAQGGVRALRRRPKTGRPPKLTPAQWRRLATLLRRGAVADGFDTEPFFDPHPVVLHPRRNQRIVALLGLDRRPLRAEAHGP